MNRKQRHRVWDHPGKGDIVRSKLNGRTREVVDVARGNITWQSKTGKLQVCWITTWRDWCRAHDAEVLQELHHPANPTEQA